jgi:hypothetical protein
VLRLILAERESPVRKAATSWAPHVGRGKKGREHSGKRSREVIFVSTVTFAGSHSHCAGEALIPHVAFSVLGLDSRSARISLNLLTSGLI